MTVPDSNADTEIIEDSDCSGEKDVAAVDKDEVRAVSVRRPEAVVAADGDMLNVPEFDDVALPGGV